MDSASRSALRRPELVTDAASAPTPESARSLTVTAVYQLSEAGRKASLLAGGDGRAVQQITVQVPTSRLHLVSVDPQGVARLRIRPRYETDAEQRVVRIDAAPTYDVPPTIDELFREAARNHERERVYLAERTVTRAKKREADHERRLQVAQAFLADRTQRAHVHPAPSPKRCYLATAQGRLLFDVATDEGPARDVPPEAHRRFRADLNAKHERNQQERAAQLALHEEKKRYIAEWIVKYGTPEQQARQAAGVLADGGGHRGDHRPRLRGHRRPPGRTRGTVPSGSRRICASSRTMPTSSSRPPTSSSSARMPSRQRPSSGRRPAHAEGAARRDGDLTCAPPRVEAAAAGAHR